MKDLLGGKGANLAEMTNIGLPVPPGFTITTEVCTDYYADGKKLPEGARRRQVAAALAQHREAGRREVRRPDEPAARLGALGRARVDARHDGHDPQPRPQRRDRRGPGREVGQRALRLRQLPPLHRRCTATSCSASSRSARTITIRSTRSSTAKKHDARREARHRAAAPTPSRSSSREFKADRQAADSASDFPDDPYAQLWGAIERGVPARGATTAPIVYRRLNDIPARVGHGRQRPGDGVRQHGRRLAPPASASRATRRPARTCSTASS